MARKKAILFDLDGTVIEPSLSISRCVNYALKKKGFKERSWDELKVYVGHPLHYIYNKLEKNLREEDVLELIEFYRERFNLYGSQYFKYYFIADILCFGWGSRSSFQVIPRLHLVAPLLNLAQPLSFILYFL